MVLKSKKLSWQPDISIRDRPYLLFFWKSYQKNFQTGYRHVWAIFQHSQHDIELLPQHFRLWTEILLNKCVICVHYNTISIKQMDINKLNEHYPPNIGKLFNTIIMKMRYEIGNERERERNGLNECNNRRKID